MATVKISNLPPATTPVAQTSLVPVVQGGITKRATVAQLASAVNVVAYGAVGDGITDDTAAIQLAVNAALANASALYAVYIPAGSYKVSSTINIGRCRIFGDGIDATRINPVISDGTPVFKAVNAAFCFIEDLRIITANFNTTNFVNGTINAQNCIGIEIDSSGGNYARNFLIRDVLISGVKTGFKLDTFIGRVEGCYAFWCETALIGSLLNSVTLENCNFEGCRKYFEITNSVGLLFESCCFEGGAMASQSASTLDSSRGVAFVNLYLEDVRTSAIIVVGGTTECRNVSLIGGTVAMNTPPTSAYNFNSAFLKFDRVNGLYVDAAISQSWYRSLYETTTNTLNFRDASLPVASNLYSPADNSNNLVAVKNYFPNSNFDLWFRGWPNVAAIDLTVAKETTLVRTGKNAVKVTKNAGVTTAATFVIAFSDGYLAGLLAGKTVTLYAWVYVPNISEYSLNFDGSGNALQTAFPSIAINTNGTGGGTTTSSQTWRPGAWSLFRISSTIPSDATTINFYAGISTAGVAATGNEYIVIDSVYLVEGAYDFDIKVTNGEVTDSDVIQTTGIGGKMVMRAAAAPTDADQTYEVGDQVLNSAPAAGGTLGWVCTTAGAGGTAVFKTFGAISA